MSDKREAFQRLSKPRIEKAIKGIQLLGNLSRKSQYEYSTLEVSQMIGALEAEIEGIKKLYKFDQQVKQSRPEPDPDPEIEQIEPESASWVAWALDRLIQGDPKAATEMLKRGLKANRSRAA